MTADLRGKVAIVTGGSRGIGAAISRRLGGAGAQVAIFYQSQRERAAALVAELATQGIAAQAWQVDVADPAALRDAIAQVADTLGRLDILVNNAGLTITGPLASYAPDAFDRVFATNVRAPFLAAQQAAALMADGGRIITIGSIIAERVPGPGATLYAASKSALVGMTKGLARDLGERGITVNLIQPGPVQTERNPADSNRGSADNSPLAIKRRGTAEEVAALAAFLASAEAAYITGSVYNVDGGWSA